MRQLSQLDDCVHSDTSVAEDNFNFLVQFFSEYPEFKTNPLILAGVSYAGVYITSLASVILKRGIDANFRGLMLGNPTFRWGVEGDLLRHAPQEIESRTKLLVDMLGSHGQVTLNCAPSFATTLALIRHSRSLNPVFSSPIPPNPAQLHFLQQRYSASSCSVQFVAAAHGGRGRGVRPLQHL
jgi:hypothetical protein